MKDWRIHCHSDGPRDVWHVYRAPLASAKVCLVVWVWSTLLTLRQAARRRNSIAAATEDLVKPRERLNGAKARLRGAAEIDLKVASIQDKNHVSRYLKVSRVVREEHVFKQARRGRPGQRQTLTTSTGQTVQLFDAELTDLQRQLLGLLGVSPKVFRHPQ